MLTPYEAFWLFGFPAAVFSWYHILRHTKSFIRPSNNPPPKPQPRVVFSIAAKKLTPSLKGPVESVIESCAAAAYTNYEIKLVVDQVQPGAELQLEGVQIILVPVEFTCESKFKARALHYALRYLPNSKDEWILHLDEDAMVTPQCVNSILNYIVKGGKQIANGPSVFHYDGNLLTFFAEAQRQWTFYWLRDQLDTSTVHWLNGSNLLIRSDVEQAVGWSFPNCFISEDSRFGYEATKKFGKIFGWHGGLTIETPPGTVAGLVKQRMRWFYGSILNLRYVPRGRLPRRIYSITAWLNGFLLTLFFFILILGIYHEPWFSHLFIIHGFTVTSIFWVSRYEIGVYQNLRQSSMSVPKRILLHLVMVPLVPFVDLLCTIPAVLAFIVRPRSFQITAKKA